MIRYRNAKLAQPLCGGLCKTFQHARAHTHREGGRGIEGRAREREGAGERESNGAGQGGTRVYL